MNQLFAHQLDLIHKNPKKHLIAFGTGTGKTATAIRLAEHNAKTCLVICPKSVAVNWERETKIWSVEACRYTIVTKETFRRDWQKLPKCDAVIVDEAHFVANYKSQLYKSLAGYLKHYEIRYIWLLTASPYLSSAWNIYSLANLLGHNWNWMKFKMAFFYDIRMGRRTVPKQKVGIENKLAALVNQIGTTKKLEECIDMPEETESYEYFSLTDAQRKVIESLPDITPIVRYSKIFQIVNGTLKSDGYTEDIVVGGEKMDRVLEIIQENKKLAVICRHLLEIKTLARLINNKKIFIISGSTENRQEVIDEVERTDDCVVIISAGVSEGYNMSSVKFMVFYSLSYSWKDFIQMKGRIKRINKPQSVVYLYLMVQKTIDEAVFDNIRMKRDFDIAIYAEQNKNL